MKKLFLGLFSTLCIFHTHAQYYAVGQRSATFTDPSRGNRPVPVQLYYPAAAAGTGVPLTTGSALFPVVVFGHGFVIQVSSYKWLADSLASNGFVAVFPETEGSIAPSHGDFGTDLAFLATRVTSLSDSSSSFLFGRLIKKAAVGGHSMGGGASFLSVSQSSAIFALFNFAAAETNPSAKQAATGVQRPSLIFAGSRDCIVPDSNQLRMYDNVPYGCKTYVSLTDALHCQFSDNAGLCAFGQLSSGCNTTPLATPTVYRKVSSLLLPFLNYYLKADCLSGAGFDLLLSGTTGISYQRTCTTDAFGCTPLLINPGNPGTPSNGSGGSKSFDESIRISPQPVKGNGMLQVSAGRKKIRSAVLFDAAGRRIYSVERMDQSLLSIPVSRVSGGIAYLRLQSNREEVSMKRIVIY
jgi:dienelactone hydrolase